MSHLVHSDVEGAQKGPEMGINASATLCYKNVMKRLLRVLARTADGVCAIDRDQTIVLWNASAERILGFAAKHVLGLPCCEVLRAIDDNGCRVCRRNCAMLRMALGDRPIATRTLSSQTRSGERLWIDVSTLVMLHDGHRTRPPVLAHQFRDASRLKALEVAQRRLSRGPRIESPVEVSTTGASGSIDLVELTGREKEVLELLADGAGTRSIAGHLFVSTATVRNHIAHILSKLGVHSRLEAVIHAIEEEHEAAGVP